LAGLYESHWISEKSVSEALFGWQENEGKQNKTKINKL
jgi:hypothetical protein